ncbi:MAG UNVERIFIED_CONTAM: hypothetical protein LVR18_43780 [Planctomycetaceae bacterium]
MSRSRDKTCKVFDATNGNPIVTFPAHGEPVYTAAFLSDSNQVVSGEADKRLKIWQAGDAKDLRTIGGFGGDVFRVRVQAGDLLLTASGDGSIHQHKAADSRRSEEIRRPPRLGLHCCGTCRPQTTGFGKL